MSSGLRLEVWSGGWWPWVVVVVWVVTTRNKGLLSVAEEQLMNEMKTSQHSTANETNYLAGYLSSSSWWLSSGHTWINCSMVIWLSSMKTRNPPKTLNIDGSGVLHGNMHWFGICWQFTNNNTTHSPVVSGTVISRFRNKIIIVLT